MTSAVPGYVTVGTAQYGPQATAWTAGAPVPVLRCPSLERTERHLGGVTAAQVRPRRGVVLSVGTPATEAAAALLATATCRPHEHVRHDELGDRLAGLDDDVPVAVVGLPEDFEQIGSWPGDLHPLVGVVTARSLETLSVLIYRTLLVEADPAAGTHVSAHPLWRGATAADVVTIQELAESAATRPALRVLRGQGRECAHSLLDGMVCGRALPRPAPLPPASARHRRTPCQVGEHCFRTDLTTDDLLPAHELNSVLSVLHSCSAVPVGNNAYDSDVSVALGLLEGTTTAVIGCIAVHVAQDSSVAELQDGLLQGLTLGEVTRRMNTETRPFAGTLARFGLLGDPAIVLPPPPAHPALTARVAEPDQPVLDQLAYYLDTVIPRLERLAWFGVDVSAQDLDDIRGAIVAQSHAHLLGAAEPPGPDPLRERLDELQRQTLHRLAEDVFDGSWNYAGTGFAGMRETGRRPGSCPSCGRTSDRLHYRHVVDVGLQVTTEQCARCGDVWWTDAPVAGPDLEPELIVSGPVDVAAERTAGFRLVRRFSNRTDRVVSGAWTAVFRSRKLHGLPAPVIHPVVCPARSDTDHHLSIDVHHHHIRPDVHTLPVLSLVDGVYAASVVMLSLAPTAP